MLFDGLVSGPGSSWEPSGLKCLHFLWNFNTFGLSAVKAHQRSRLMTAEARERSRRKCQYSLRNFNTF